jgi:hypothetical protein
MQNQIPTMAKKLIEQGLMPIGRAKNENAPTEHILIDLGSAPNAFAIGMLKDGPLTRKKEDLVAAMQSIHDHNPDLLSRPNAAETSKHAKALLGTPHFSEMVKKSRFCAEIRGNQIVLTPRK